MALHSLIRACLWLINVLNITQNYHIEKGGFNVWQVGRSGLLRLNKCRSGHNADIQLQSMLHDEQGALWKNSNIFQTLSEVHDERLQEEFGHQWENDVGKSKMNKNRKTTRSISDRENTR
jgi:hypothetical protein